LHHSYIPNHDIREGQVSENDIIAPFSFEIIKDDTQLQLEKENLINSIHPVYSLSDEIGYNSINRINEMFTSLYGCIENGNRDSLRNLVIDLGYEITYTEVNHLYNKRRLQTVWDYVMVATDSLQKQGIIENPVDETILFERNGRAETIYTSKFLTVGKAARTIAAKYPDDDIQGFIEYILYINLSPNVVVDQTSTNELVKGKNENISSVLDVVQKNEILIRKNTRISHLDYLKYKSMMNSDEFSHWKQDKRMLFIRVVGFGLLSFLVFSIFRYTLFRLAGVIGNKAYLFYLSLFLAECILYLIFKLFTNVSPYIFPILFFILLPAIVISTKSGLIFGLFLLILNLLTFGISGSVQLYHIFIGMCSIVLIDRSGVKQSYGTLAWTLLVAGFIVILLLGFIHEQSFLQIVNNFIYALIGIAISVTGLISLAGWTESKLDIVSNNQLVSLLDFNHPLLKRLATEAPGTYHHSLVVSNLAERAAEEIGADYLLARVGSYYHDIGKLKTPELFTENNEDSDTLHDAMKCEESAEIIKEHVNYGVLLAKQYNLPNSVVDIIREHHGTQAIKYFLKKAKENKLETPQHSFYYNGPKPLSKISAIIMIADIVESKTKVFNEFKPEIIEKTLDDLIANKQLLDCELSFRELKQVKEVMNIVLGSIYRKRKDYKIEEYEE
jgi:putative nucleotidyltransferase with HDIG domain